MALAVGVAAVSVWASGWQRFTWGARIGTFACALVVLLAGALRLPRHGEPATRRRCRGDAAWLALIIPAAAWDALALLTPPGRHHLTLSATELADRPFHAALFALWLAVGWTLASAPLRARPRTGGPP